MDYEARYMMEEDARYKKIHMLRNVAKGILLFVERDRTSLVYVKFQNYVDELKAGKLTIGQQRIMYDLLFSEMDVDNWLNPNEGIFHTFPDGVQNITFSIGLRLAFVIASNLPLVPYTLTWDLRNDVYSVLVGAFVTYGLYV